MNKLPVGRVIAHAYGFLFGRILTIVSLSWVAAVFYAALRFHLFKLGPIPQPIADHWQLTAIHFGGILASLLLFSAIAIPLTRAALGGRGDWHLAHFAISAPEIRLFLAVIRAYAAIIALIAVCVAAVIGAGMGVTAGLAQWPAAAASGLPIEAGVHVALVVVAVLLTIYVSLRLSFLLWPVAAVEPHASLKRAWLLARGNVLRILAVFLAVMVPVYALVFAGEYALMGPALIEAGRALFASAHPDITPLQTLFIANSGAVSIGAGVLLVVLVALGSGASAGAYLALTGAVAEEPVEEVIFEEEDVAMAVEAHPVMDAAHDRHAEAVEAAHEAEPAPAPHEPEADHGEEAHGHDAHAESGETAERASEDTHAAADAGGHQEAPTYGETDPHGTAPEVHHEVHVQEPVDHGAQPNEGSQDHAQPYEEPAHEEHAQEALPAHQPAAGEPQPHIELQDALEDDTAERVPEHA